MLGSAKDRQSGHTFSTLFTAQNVRDFLSTEAGVDAAIDWCRRISVSKVYIEVFRDDYQASAPVLQHAKERFLSEGFDVSGCVTTTRVGKPSTGAKELISCYTDQASQDRIQSIFEYAAKLFDEVMIDDFWFTDCACPQCDSARRSKLVTIGEHTYPVPDDGWSSYRCELMVNLSRDRVLAPAKRVNPNVKLIIKYPQWYDRFHDRGYEVARESADFDRIWVGTETRDYDDRRWGGVAQYRAYFIMRWLGGIGGEKCGGGWYDPFGTTEHTYLEQARQTVLGGGRESFLFCYGSLLEGDDPTSIETFGPYSVPMTRGERRTGARNIDALRENISELIAVSGQLLRREIVGVAAYKPPNSSPEGESYVFDFVGMMGLPLVPCHEFPMDSPAAFFSMHALADGDLVDKLITFIASGKPVLLTDGLAKKLKGRIELNVSNVGVLQVKDKPRVLLQIPQKRLDAIRQPLLTPLGIMFQAPSKATLYLFRDGSWVVENFNDNVVEVKLNERQLEIPARGWSYEFVGD
jgi:hypothetical protein